MEQERQSIRVGVAVIVCAALLRLCSAGVLDTVAALFVKPEVAAFLLYLETGIVVHEENPATQPDQTQPTEPPTQPSISTQPTVPSVSIQQTESVLPEFRREDAHLVQIRNQCGYEADVPAMLESRLEWDLTQNGPAVLIVHSHATESYLQEPGQDYQESSAYRTLDDRYNMISIGNRVAEILQAGGITVIHDTTLHDHPSYTAAYGNSREAIQEYLQQYPSIRVVLDIHRDAADLEGGQLTTLATVDGKPSSQLMMVVGTDANGLHHPNWVENMAFAIKLTAQLEKSWPGLTRAIHLRSERFNQDLCQGGLLVEVGAAGDTHEQAVTAAEALAKGILALCRGTTTVNSTS